MEISTTPAQLWEAYRNMVFDGTLTEQQEFECKRAFFAGSETVFKLLESVAKLDPARAGGKMKHYRDLNRAAAMETIPDDEQEENLN